MYNPQPTSLLIVVFFCMLAAIAGGMMIMPGDNDEQNDQLTKLIASHHGSVAHFGATNTIAADFK